MGVKACVWPRVLGEVLPSVLAGFRPDVVLYDAGVDTHMHDSLGKLNLTDKGLRRRELQVGLPLDSREHHPAACLTGHPQHNEVR